jgi:hypothetical protein
VAIVGASLFFRGFKKLRTLRRIENTPTSNIRSMPMGSVEVEGVARIEEPLHAPFSDKPVAYYEIEIEEYRGSGKNSRWVTIYEEASEDPFYLDDGTGQVLVIPQGAELRLRKAFEYKNDTFSGVPPHLERFLSSQNLRGGFFGRWRSLCFTERHIQTGQLVYVYGVAQERRGLDLWRERMELVTEKLREIKADPEKLQRFDTDGDGRISEDEWQSAHSQAVAEVRGEAVADRIVIAKGSSDKMFLISDRSERELVSRLRLQSAASVVGGGAGFIAGVVFLVYRLIATRLLS